MSVMMNEILTRKHLTEEQIVESNTHLNYNGYGEDNHYEEVNAFIPEIVREVWQSRHFSSYV